MHGDRAAGILPDEQEPDDLEELADEPDLAEEDLAEENLVEEEPDAGHGEEPEGEEPSEARLPQTVKRPGRRERQSAEIRELRERSERLERELQSVRGQQQQPRVDNSAELARVAAYERDQLPLLPADQIASYYHNKALRTVGDALSRQEIAITERLDKSSWDAACRSSARRARFAPQVEATLQSERQQGRYPDRETIYRYLLGDEIERQAGRRAPGQRQAAQRRVRSQTTQPGGSRSDVARNRQPAASGDDYEGAMARTRGKALW